MIILILETLIIIIIKLIKKFKNKLKNKNYFNWKKGKYLSLIGNCLACHTVEGGKPFSGGYSIKTKFGIINSPNITQNKKYGCGKLKLKNFYKIIKYGISNNNNFLFPVLPYINFNKIKKNDLKNIFFFFKKIKKEKIINKKNKIKLPIKYKKLIIYWRILFFKKIFLKYKKKKSNVKRGEYIVQTLGHCNMCHNKNNMIGKINKNFEFNEENRIKKWIIKKINYRGLKNKNIKEIYKILKEGNYKKKIINSFMIKVINNSLQFINKIDIISISKYLKNIINKKILKRNIKKSINQKKIKTFYKKSCKKCHGKMKLGNFPIYPKLENIKKNKNIKNIIKKKSIINTLKNKYASVMPNLL